MEERPNYDKSPGKLHARDCKIIETGQCNCEGFPPMPEWAKDQLSEKRE